MFSSSLFIFPTIELLKSQVIYDVEFSTVWTSTDCIYADFTSSSSCINYKLDNLKTLLESGFDFLGALILSGSKKVLMFFIFMI